MSSFTIENFWSKRLNVKAISGRPVKGWSFKIDGLEAFMEAPLTESELTDEISADAASVVLVSAPGAVGKSTLARQIASVTGAIYVDLAVAEPVGGNSMTGGLARSGLFASWEGDAAALLIDGLDEARLRVTQSAFEAFLEDVATLAKDRKIPTVLFGRTGAVQDAWLFLDEYGATPAILEIGYYDETASSRFARLQLEAIKRRSLLVAEEQCVDLILSRLRKQTESDGDRFAGYAPVLQAVADRVGRETNAAALVAQIEKGEQPVTLETVADAILERERGKLDKLVFERPEVVSQLYLKAEQLDRLVARVFGLPAPKLPSMTPADAKTYSDALESWVGEHPFLKGPRTASSVVFDAMITTRALRNRASEPAAANRELARGAAANPFLAEFYLPDSSEVVIPGGHIGIIYASLRARLALGDTASLSVDGPEPGDNEPALRAEVEITVARKNSNHARTLHFFTSQSDVLRLGAYLEDVEVAAPHAEVELGPGAEVVLVAPVSIQVQILSISAERVVVDPSRTSDQQVVFLEATRPLESSVASVPTVRPDVQFSASWPGVSQYPWTAFASEPALAGDPRIDEGLRRFRKFVVAFRSHSKGNLARFRDKLDHGRMTKGSGQKILNYMVKTKILSLVGSMYYLDPDRLGAVAGATYADCVTRRYNSTTLKFIEAALNA